MKITSKTGEELNFLETGVDGVYVLDRVAFRDRFDKDGNSDWEKSTGRKRLREWAESNLPKEILDRFDVDIPAVEEVFSQKMLNIFKSGKGLKSRQLPIFRDSDNRMMEFDDSNLNGKLMWWWTSSAYGGDDDARHVWSVYTDSSLYYDDAYNTNGFVPVLRKREGEAECWARLKEAAEEYAQKHMHPHKTIIITQQGIELLEGEKASPLETLD